MKAVALCLFAAGLAASTPAVALQAPGPQAAAEASLAQGPVRTAVAADGLVGDLYTPATKGRGPAVLVLGGSEGGLQGSSPEARRIAGRGYVALALAYFGAPGTPPELTNIPLEYFKKAIDWLKAQPGVDPDRIGIVGTSKGAEAALLVASHYPDIKVVVAGVPANVAWQGYNRHDYMDRSGSWMLGGKPVAFVPYDMSAPFTSVHDLYQRSLAKLDQHPDAVIAVEHIRGPVMLVCGQADALWPSCPMAEGVKARLEAKGFPFKVQLLSYPNAGHAAFGPPIPADSPAFSMLAQLGGDQPGNLAARADSWPKALAFLDAALKR